MGIGCCNCKEKPKEKEVILPKIKYNIYEINRMAKLNSNNDNIMTNINEQDIISRSSLGYELDKKFDSIDDISPNSRNKIQNNNSSIKYRLLGQIKEKDQKYEQDQENNSNNEGFNQLEKINVNHLINDVDKLNKQHIINKKNNIKIDELKDMNQIKYNSKNMDEYYKMNQYNIDIESQRKIRGDCNTNNNFENSNEEYPIEENKNNSHKDEILNNYINLETKNENMNEQNNENNDELFQIEVNDELDNSENNNINNSKKEELEPKINTMNNNEYNQDNGNKINNGINNIKKDFLENNDFSENNNKIKNSFNNFDNLDDYPLIDDDNNNFNNKIISNKEEINSMDNNGEKYIEDKNEFFYNNMNQFNDNSLSEIENKYYEDSLNDDENKINPYRKKRIKKLSKEIGKKEE